MRYAVDRAVSDPLDPRVVSVPIGDPPLDVPGLSASRISDLYASEERSRRQAHADRLMRQAAQLAQE
jgi:hypothetical protein